MYPQQELIRLDAHKAALRRAIALSRAQCADAATRLTRPLGWLDRVIAFGRRIAPFAAVPLGLLALRTVSTRFKWLGPLLSWGPPVLGSVRGLIAAAQIRR